MRDPRNDDLADHVAVAQNIGLFLLARHSAGLDPAERREIAAWLDELGRRYPGARDNISSAQRKFGLPVTPLMPPRTTSRPPAEVLPFQPKDD